MLDAHYTMYFTLGIDDADGLLIFIYVLLELVLVIIVHVPILICETCPYSSSHYLSNHAETRVLLQPKNW